MIVITLSKIPMSLRGDLTKWCQEIQTGVYVGNVNAKVRDLLWQRIQKNIGNGEATLVYNTNNELGYTFRTTRTDKQVVDYDGIPFLMQLKSKPQIDYGFSNAAKFRKARSSKYLKKRIDFNFSKFVVIDIETTGVDPNKDKIISVGAIKTNEKQKPFFFYKLVKIDSKIPKRISDLTDITDSLLDEKGISLHSVLKQLKNFIGDRVIIGYNLPFDINFLELAFKKVNEERMFNSTKDILPVIKRANKFLDDYHLNTVLEEYDINNRKPHNAKWDAEATWKLVARFIDDGILKI